MFKTALCMFECFGIDSAVSGNALKELDKLDDLKSVTEHKEFKFVQECDLKNEKVVMSRYD